LRDTISVEERGTSCDDAASLDPAMTTRG
jgi:hypothetical protein